MKKLLVIFLVSSVQALFAMKFPITAAIKKNMKELHPFTLHPSHPKPSVEDCKAPNRILIARVDRVSYRYQYLRFETDEQVDQLVNQIPEENKMTMGEVWKIEWFYYDPLDEVHNEAMRKFNVYIHEQEEDVAESLCASDENPYLFS